jgi:hypothetical protein
MIRSVIMRQSWSAPAGRVTEALAARYESVKHNVRAPSTARPEEDVS